MRSLFFEDLVEGTEFRTDECLPITKESVDSYCELTGDAFRVHKEDAFALACGLKGAIVPGNMVTAIATGLVFRLGYCSESLFVQARKDVRFVEPLYLGQTIYVIDRVMK